MSNFVLVQCTASVSNRRLSDHLSMIATNLANRVKRISIGDLVTSRHQSYLRPSADHSVERNKARIVCHSPHQLAILYGQRVDKFRHRVHLFTAMALHIHVIFELPFTTKPSQSATPCHLKKAAFFAMLLHCRLDSNKQMQPFSVSAQEFCCLRQQMARDHCF